MKRITWIAGVSFVLGALFFALTFGFLQRSSDDSATLAPQAVEAQSIEVQPSLNFVPLVRRVKPAVVKVVSEAIVEQQPSLFGDDLFDRFFNSPRRRQRVSGVGTGFVISADGDIVTNYHVVKSAIKIKIVDLKGKEYTAKKIGTDPKTDLALLKIDAKNLPYIEFGDSSNVAVGEWVLAIGNPLGQDLTVTSGIVSAKGRELEGLDVDYQDFIQTDAPINRGNSGGPLVNLEGKAIGITSVILSPSGGNIGIGFAIPSNMARRVLADLKKSGRVVRGYLGISMNEITDAEAKDYDLPEGGILVLTVEENSPAQKSGLQRYDVIVGLNGKPIESMGRFRNQVAEIRPGSKITLTVVRRKGKLEIPVTVGEAPDSLKVRLDSDEGTGEVVDLGMVVINNNASLARRHNLSTDKGVVVTQVARGGTAAENGLRPGDIILGVNRSDVESVRQFRELISGKRAGDRVLMFINRDGNEIPLRFRF
ncbi:MAG TPA: Do family serine endopeptidase [Candidatus Aminicenantes bacterium]|nr:Do family serine endopeptidase [Candidatus Aminicenantes bacterium]